MNGQPPTAKNDFRGLEGQNPITIFRHDPGHKVNHTGNLIGNLILKVRLDGTDFVAALPGQVTGTILMGNQNDIFIVQIDKPLQGVQELGTYHVPCPEGIIGFMFPALPVTDKHPATFIDIFQQVNHNGFEVVLFLFQFGHSVQKHFIGQLALSQPPFHGDFILDRDNRSINAGNHLDISIGVQHKRIREGVGKSGFAAERRSINPDHFFLLAGSFPALIFGKNHVIPSFLAIFFILTPPAKVVWVQCKIGGFDHALGAGQEIHHLQRVIAYRLHPWGGIL